MPTVSLAIAVLGYVYYLVFAYLVPRIKRERLVVERAPTIVRDGGEWVQAVERVETVWVARDGGVGGGGNYVEVVTVQAKEEGLGSPIMGYGGE